MDLFPSEGFTEIITFMQDCKYNLGFVRGGSKRKRRNRLLYFHTDVNTAILLLIKFTKFPHAWRERHYIRAIARILEVCYETNYRDRGGFRAMLKSFKPSVVRIISDVYIEEIRLGDKVGFLRYLLEMLAECKFDLGERCCALDECSGDESTTSLESLMNTRIFWNALGHGSFEEIMVLLQHDYPIMVEIYHRMGNRVTSPIVNGIMVVYCVLILRADTDARKVLMACLEAVPFPIPTVNELCAIGVQERYQDRYKEILPEVLTLVHQPRTLKHLSRCAIRNQLRSCLRTPREIDALPLNKELKDYVGLRHTEIEMKFVL